MKHDFLTCVCLYESKEKQQAMVYLYPASAGRFKSIACLETIPVDELSQSVVILQYPLTIQQSKYTAIAA